MHELLQAVYTQVLHLTWLEIIAFASGLIYVVLAARENVWCWAVGLINVIAFFIISIKALFYSDAGLQVFYFVLTLYGWYQWVYASKTNNQQSLNITTTSNNIWIRIIVFITISTLLQGSLLAAYTNTDVPYWDSLTTSISLAATWMVANKKLENWLLWILVDPIYVGLFYYKGWYLSSFLFAIYTLIAIAGYFSWRKTYRNLALRG